jgi:O-antigen/teichoic acid export membrane protein
LGFRLLKFVGLILCARILSLHDFGVFSTLFSLTSIFGAVSVFGMHNTVVKYAEETTREGASAFRHLMNLSFGTNLILSLLFALAVFILRDAISHYLGVPVTPLLIGVAATIPMAIGRTMTFVFRALREPIKSVAIDVSGPACFIALLGLLAVSRTSSLWMLMVGNFLSLALPLVIGFSLLNRFARALPTVVAPTERKRLSTILSFSFFSFIVTLSSLSGGEMDRLFLAWFLDPQTVGQYNAAARSAFQLNIFYFAFTYAFAPQVVKENLNGAISIERDHKRWFLFFWLTAPFYLATLGLGRYFLLMFGRDYLAALQIFLILALGAYVNLLLGPSEVYLRMLGYQKREAVYMVLSMVITIFLDLVLIPKIGMYGAAAGTALGFLAFKILATVFAVQQGLMRIPRITWARIIYPIPPLLGAATTDNPVTLVALVCLSLILMFVIERVPLRELWNTAKELIINIPGSEAKTGSVG